MNNKLGFDVFELLGIQTEKTKKDETPIVKTPEQKVIENIYELDKQRKIRLKKAFLQIQQTIVNINCAYDILKVFGINDTELSVLDVTSCSIKTKIKTEDIETKIEFDIKDAQKNITNTFKLNFDNAGNKNELRFVLYKNGFAFVEHNCEDLLNVIYGDEYNNDVD